METMNADMMTATTDHHPQFVVFLLVTTSLGLGSLGVVSHLPAINTNRSEHCSSTFRSIKEYASYEKRTNG